MTGITEINLLGFVGKAVLNGDKYGLFINGKLVKEFSPEGSGMTNSEFLDSAQLELARLLCLEASAGLNARVTMRKLTPLWMNIADSLESLRSETRRLLAGKLEGQLVSIDELQAFYDKLREAELLIKNIAIIL